MIIAVSKGRTFEEIRKVYETGVRDFGESRVAEALEKMVQLPNDIRWHFIGKLQKNKVNKVVGKFALVHSVDSVELAKKLAQASVERGLITAILLQANTSGEKSKSGLSPAEWKARWPQVKSLKGLNVQGCMTMAPHTDDQQVIRRCFSALRELRDDLGLKELSMGMSNDHKIALEEGATMVRLGKAIFDETR